MRPASPRYPVDRYLVESSKEVKMVNIMNDDIWNSDPALRPEDEIILRKLHEMLQSTADDLKLLSGELSKYHEPGVQVKTAPTPMDEEFNEKVHIEELVNAKFHGYKMIDKSPQHIPNFKNKTEINSTEIKSLSNNLNKHKVSAGVQVNPMHILKKPIKKNLSISSTKVMEINVPIQEHIKQTRLNNAKVINNRPAVNCSEFSYIYSEPTDNTVPRRLLKVQDMPSINIRSELTEQRVLNLDIFPDNQKDKQIPKNENNVAFVTMLHEHFIVEGKPNTKSEILSHPQLQTTQKKIPTRKISRISESSGSTNNISSDAQHKLKSRRQIALKLSPKYSSRISSKRNQKSTCAKEPVEKRSQLNLDEWKKKLNTVYGQPPTSRKSKLSVKSKISISPASPKKSKQIRSSTSILNNASYVPYSQLTLGGVRVSDIEKEISDIPNRNELPLSPILDRILNSQENSFNKRSTRKLKKKEIPKILTTSDENLLQEVMDIETTVSKTLRKNAKEVGKSEIKRPDVLSDGDINDNDESYADDFEDEKSDIAEESIKQNSNNESNPDNDSEESGKINEEKYIYNREVQEDRDDVVQVEVHNATYTKLSNLSFKNEVDIHEYVHSIDTQDIATQSTTAQKISLKETQTSPRNERAKVQPIHNDLWSSIDPNDDVEKMLKLEKDFIKKLIIEEYSDLLEKNIAKPSTSKNNELEDTQINTASLPKNTQTSPAHVKSVMTSPPRTKTRTTSPLVLSLPVNRQTSPMICVTSEEDLKLDIENGVDDLGITINLSSPRFSLRLPQNSREVLSNCDGCQTPSKNDHKGNNTVKESKTFRKCTSSSSSVDAYNSSSEISSLGEINLKLKRRLMKNKFSSISDSSLSSALSVYSSDLQSVGILPLKSEGEVSLGQARNK